MNKRSHIENEEKTAFFDYVCKTVVCNFATCLTVLKNKNIPFLQAFTSAINTIVLDLFTSTNVVTQPLYIYIVWYTRLACRKNTDSDTDKNYGF